MKKLTLLTISVPLVLATNSFSATSAQLYVDKLNTSVGVNNPASIGTWALIYNQNTSNGLPGGLSDGTSLTSGSTFSDFNNLQLALGATLSTGDVIIGIGTIPLSGIVDEVITFDIGGTDGNPSTPSVTTGRSFALYWFPTLSIGATVNTTGAFEIGGFFEQSPHLPSFSDYGMTIPADGQSGSFLAFDSQLGFSESRLVAVAVPEASSLALSALGLGALLRRRRK